MGELSISQTKIGAFVVFGLFLIMGSIFFLGADKSVFSSHSRLHSHFENVSGLAVGSVVTLSGVNIGNVEFINFVPSSKLLDIVMKIENRYIDKVKKGSLAEIRTQGALGDKFIYIIPGEPDQTSLVDGDHMEAAKATDIMGIFSERGKDTEKIFDIINEIYKMTKTINSENRVDRILYNLQQTSANLNSASMEIKKISNGLDDQGTSGKVKKSVAHLESILGKIDKGEGTLGALVNDSAIHEQLKSLLGANPRKQHLRSVLRNSIQQSDGN